MKTNFNNAPLNISILSLVMFVLLGLAPFHTVTGQEKKVFQHDFLMPAKGKSMVEFYSGIPYVAIGQYSYGFSNRVSVGIFYGNTPFVKGYGVRVKALIAQPSESFRVNIKSPFIYYPNMEPKDGDSWMLAWPTLNGEWKLKNGTRLWTGAGLIAAACTDMLFHSEEVPEPEDPPGMPPKEEEEFSLFNTFQFGYSKPLSDKWSFVAEVAPVMEGFKLKSKSGFLDTSPVILTVGLSCSF